MICKSCGAFLSDDLTECPVCSSSTNNESDSENVTLASDDTDLDAPVSDDEIKVILEREIDEQSNEPQSPENNDTENTSIRKDGIYIDQMIDITEVKSKKVSTSSIVAIVLAVLLTISATFCAILIIGKHEDSPLNSIYTKITGFFSNVFSDNKTKEYGADEVIAVFGDHTFTNAELSIYYYDLVYEYYSYFSAFGKYLFDPSTSLFEQEFSETQSWGDYFVAEAIESWKFAIALCDMAKENNFTLSDDINETLSNVDKTLEESAVAQGYESAEAFLKEHYGSFVTMKDYIECLNDYFVSNSYYNIKYEEKYRNYLDDNIDSLETYNVSVRHILISPEIEDDEGSLAEAKVKADAVVKEWLDMGGTEDNLASLVEKYTADTASIPTGGLYEDFQKGKMFEEFENWSFDATRKYGDYGIVKTQAGYHIMFFVTRTNPEASIKTQEELASWVEQYMNTIPLTKHLDKVNIKDVS